MEEAVAMQKVKYDVIFSQLCARLSLCEPMKHYLTAYLRYLKQALFTSSPVAFLSQNRSTSFMQLTCSIAWFFSVTPHTKIAKKNKQKNAVG